MAERPLCECHGEPMSAHGSRWRCSVLNRKKVAAHYRQNATEIRERRRRRYHEDPEPDRARSRRRYDSLSGVEYNRLLLRNRRSKALARMKARTLAEDKGGTDG